MSASVNDSAMPTDLENGSTRRPDGSYPVEFEPENKINGAPEYQQDAFGNEEGAEVKYKVLKWWYVLACSIGDSSLF